MEFGRDEQEHKIVKTWVLSSSKRGEDDMMRCRESLRKVSSVWNDLKIVEDRKGIVLVWNSETQRTH